jgi:hypothetical protein
MLLFTRKLTAALEYAKAETPDYQFLNKSPRAAVEKVRVLMENWLSHMPTPEVQRIEATFRSSKNQEHWSALFELYCHELLTRSGYQVSMHRPGNMLRRKDFHVVRSGVEAEVEATICIDSDPIHAGRALLNRLTDFLDDNSLVPGFRYSLEVEQSLSQLPPLKMIANDIKSWAATFDRTQIRRILEGPDPTKLPFKTFSAGGWTLKITLIPRPTDENDLEESARAIGIGPVYESQMHHDTALRNSLKTKANHYKDHRVPFIVAVAAIFDFSMHDEIDVFQSLLGTEQITYDMRTMTHTSGRGRDGLWIGPKGPRNRNVSAVLIANQLRSWYLPRAALTLYVNPWARHPISSNFLNVRTVTWDLVSGRMVDTPGLEPWELFGLSPTWPEEGSDIGA